MLRITTGAMEGRQITCDRALVIGREGVDVVIDDGEMSRRHAMVTPGRQGLEIEDLGSLNGTFVKGQKISGKVTLEPNAEVRLGTTHFTVEAPVPSADPVIGPGAATAVSPVVPQAPDGTVIRERPVIPDTDRTVIRDQPAERREPDPMASREPVAEPVPPAAEPIPPAAEPIPPAESAPEIDEALAQTAQPTVARGAPVMPDTGKTVMRDEPLIAPQDPTVVRDAIRGLPTAEAPGGAASGPGARPERASRKIPLGAVLLVALIVVIVLVVVFLL